MNKLFSSAVIIGALTYTSITAFAETITFNAVSLAPKRAGISSGFKMFVKEVNEKFKGEFEIKWRGGPEVMPPFNQVESVRVGAMDLTFTSPSYYAGLVPSAPSMNLSTKNYNEIKATGYYEFMTKIHAKSKLIFLGEVPASDIKFHIFLRDKIENLEGLKNQRIRVFPTVLPMVKELGASPIVLPLGEIYTAMERGAIDGLVRSKIDWAEQFEGVVKYMIEPGVYRAGFPIVVNEESWAKLPEELQKRVVTFVRDDLAPRIDASWSDYVKKGDKQVKEAGFSAVKLSGEVEQDFLLSTMNAAWDDLASKVTSDADKETIAKIRKMLTE